MCHECLARKEVQHTDDAVSVYEDMLARGLRYRDMEGDTLRKAVEQDPQEESGGEDFLAEELILAASLGLAMLRVGEPASELLLSSVAQRGIRHLDDAISVAQPSFAEVYSYGTTQEVVRQSLKNVLRSGSALAGSKKIIDDTFRINQILEDMALSTKYFTNNYFNSQVVPKLQKIVQETITNGTLEDTAFKALQKTLSDRLNSVPYWRVVANSAASRGYHYGAVKAGIVVGKRAYKIVAVLDDRTTEVCRAMHGREFWLADADVLVTRIAAAEKDQIKVVAPWVTSADDVKDKTVSELKDKGAIMPPLHPNCRSTIQFL